MNVKKATVLGVLHLLICFLNGLFVFQPEYSSGTDGTANAAPYTRCALNVSTSLCIRLHIDAHLAISAAIATTYALPMIGGNSEA
jgi:hypothetical protein